MYLYNWYKKGKKDRESAGLSYRDRSWRVKAKKKYRGPAKAKIKHME